MGMIKSGWLTIIVYRFFDKYLASSKTFCTIDCVLGSEPTSTKVINHCFSSVHEQKVSLLASLLYY